MQLHEEERLSAYLDGELDELETARLERDLQQDPRLREGLNALRGARAWIQREGPVRAPESFYDKVMDAVHHDEQKTSRYAWWRRPIGMPVEGLAMAAVVLLVLYAALPEPQAPEPEAPRELTPAVRLENAVLPEEGALPEEAAPVFLAPQGWIVNLPPKAGLELLANAAMASRASFVTPAGDPLKTGPAYGSTHVRVAAANAARLERALTEAGAELTAIGEAHPVTGFVQLRLEVRVAP
jgi:anti-sigma factor RsiW